MSAAPHLDSRATSRRLAVERREAAEAIHRFECGPFEDWRIAYRLCRRLATRKLAAHVIIRPGCRFVVVPVPEDMESSTVRERLHKAAASVKFELTPAIH